MITFVMRCLSAINKLTSIHVCIILLCLSTLFNNTILAYESKQISNYIFRNIQNGDGLIDPQINDIIKDRDGFIWLATPSNVQRFDGIKTVFYDFSEQDNHVVHKLLQRKDGDIIAATGDGLWTIDRKKNLLVRVFPDISGPVHSLEENNGEIYVVASDGLYVIDSNGKTKRLSDLQFLDVLSSDVKGIYLLSRDGLYMLNDDVVSRIGDGNIGCGFTCMSDYGKSILIGTDGKGVYYFDKSTKCFSKSLTVGNNRISNISARNGMFVVGTSGTGIYIIDSASHGAVLSLTVYPNEDGQHISNDLVKCVMVDDLGIIWIGYQSHVGFDYIQYQNKPFSLFSCRDKLPTNIDYPKIFIDGDIKIFAAHNGLFFIDNLGNIRYNKLPNISGSNYVDIRCIKRCKNAYLVGTSWGLYMFDSDNAGLGFFVEDQKLKNTSINSMTLDDNNNLLLATDSGLFLKNLDYDSVKIYNSENSALKSNKIKYVYLDNKGHSLISTDEGLYLFDGSEFKTVNLELPDYCKGPVTFMAEDNKFNKLFVIDRKHAFLSDADFGSPKRICTSEDAGFLGLFIDKILQDVNDNYWFVGSRGVVKGNPSLSDYTLFSSTEGLIEPFSNDGQIFNDTLWISTPKGIFYTYINSQIERVPTRFTDITVNGESRLNDYYGAINAGTTVYLSEKDDNIEFTFATLSYDHPYRMIYEYKLEGLEDEWKVLRGTNHVSYKNLPKGKYRFVVRKQMDNASLQYLNFVVGSAQGFNVLGIIILIAGFALLAVIAVVIYRRRQLKKNDNSDELSMSVQSNGDLSGNEEIEKYKFNRLSDDNADDIACRLNKYMDEVRPYLNPDLKLSVVASVLGVTPQVLSQVLNTRLNVRFNDYVNKYRVEVFKEYINSGEASKYTLQSLAKLCGFSSYSTFFRAFKDITGQTPNDYVKAINHVDVDDL